MKKARLLRIVELYAGTARSTEPFRRWRRCEISLLVDNNLTAEKTYIHNFPNVPYLRQNLTRAHTPRLLEKAGGPVDIVLGCPPCQGFSDAGLRNPHDPRNSHLLNFARLALAFRPRAVAMENVPLAVAGKEFPIFLRRMEAAGYRWTAGILNAALRGSCQTRQRLVFIAIRKDIGVTPEIPDPSHGGSRKYFNYGERRLSSLNVDRTAMLGETPGLQRTADLLPFQETVLGPLPIPFVGDVLSGLPAIGTPEAVRLGHVPWAHTSVSRCRMAHVREGGRWSGGKDHYSHTYGRLHRKGLARTVTTFFPNSGSGRFWHPIENRTLTLREAARIQGFPDSFLFIEPYSHAADLVGNALDSSIATVVYNVIRNCLE